MSHPSGRDWNRETNPFEILIDREQFFKMFGSCPLPEPKCKPNARIPKYNEEGLYESQYKDED